MSGISYYHKLGNHPDPASSFLVTKIFQGVRKLKPGKDKRQPITRIRLHRLCRVITRVTISVYEQVLFKAMFMCAFYALCRISELTGKPDGHTLQAEGLKFKQNPLRCIITFKTFKHSTTAQSVTIHPQLPKEFCPVSAIQAFMQMRPSGGHHLFILQSGQPVPRTQFNHILRKALTTAQINPQHLTSHSFRIGGAIPLRH